MERDLRKALLSDEFVMHYQPLVNLLSGQISGFEALIRWNHPERGMIFGRRLYSVRGGNRPDRADRGMGASAGLQGCRGMAGRPQRRGEPVSRAVQGRRFMPNRKRCAGISALSADRLELEITETALLHRSCTALESCGNLRALGVRIAMDDFGTGHSSLSDLRSFPFDKIKIDRCFVHDLLPSRFPGHHPGGRATGKQPRDQKRRRKGSRRKESSTT